MSTSSAGEEWKDLGRFTVCSIVDGRIYAVLYWSEGFAGQRPGEEALSASGAGWFLVFVDDPDVQIKITAPSIEGIVAGMPEDELTHATRSAVAVAGTMIRKRLGLGDSA